MPGSLFVQLPLNPGSALEPTGNVPLAGATLAAAAGLPAGSVLPQDDADLLGDRALVDRIASREPERVLFTLYCWNVERSLWMAGRLRERIPRLVTVGGGPEVFLDNTPLMNDGRMSVLVSGEGEELISRVLKGGRHIPEGGYLQSGGGSFPPGRYPNPYLTGHLDPGSGDSVYVETVRGCPSTCIYCSYRRSSPRPRAMHASEAVGLLKKLKAANASEIVFVDPTFSDRRDLAPLLDSMRGMGLECFCELRGESIDPKTARRFARAGFRSAEIGLQSLSDRVTRGVGRPGNARKAIEGACMLRDEGVVPVIDLILGLPGEDPDDAVDGAVELRKAGLHREVQVFYLAVLPGTELRRRAGDLRIEWMEKPPYYATSVGDANADRMKQAREKIADILGYDLDTEPRPLLFDGWPGAAEIDLDDDAEPPPPLSFRHSALRLSSRNPWARREKVLRRILRHRADDPFCVLDVILLPGSEFPMDLIDMIEATDEPLDYSGRTAAFHGLPGNLRLTVLLHDWSRFSGDWLSELARTCRTVASVHEPDDLPPELARMGVGVLLPGDRDLAGLARKVDSPELVFFRSWEMERLWTRDVLGLD